jgi:hypothetical protein
MSPEIWGNYGLEQGRRRAGLRLMDRGGVAVNAQRDFGISPPKYTGAAGSPPSAETGQPRLGRGSPEKIKEYQ